MSANIYWQPAKGKSVDVATPSSFMASMQRAFGDPPWNLTHTQWPMLEGMSAVAGGPDNPYDQLLAAIDRHDTIRVWSES